MMNSRLPLLDVYKVAYREKRYFCIGYQLIIRVALVTTRHLLDKTLHLTITILVLGFAIGVHGYICPFKNRRLNLQELVVIFQCLHSLCVSNVWANSMHCLYRLLCE